MVKSKSNNGLIPVKLNFFGEEASGASAAAEPNTGEEPNKGETSAEAEPALNMPNEKIDEYFAAKIDAYMKARDEADKGKTPEQLLEEQKEEVRIGKLQISAHKSLSDNGLDPRWADVLNYGSEESVKKSIETVKALFNEELERGINKRLAGDGPPKSPSAVSRGNIRADFNAALTKVINEQTSKQ